MANLSEKSSTEELDWLNARWSERLAQAVESMAGAAPRLEKLEQDAETPADGEPLFWCQRLSLGEEAILMVGCGAGAWQGIGDGVLKAAGLEDADNDTIRSTYIELLGQALATVARDIGVRTGHEVVCQAGEIVAQEPAGLIRVRWRMSLGARTDLDLAFSCSPSLLAALAQESGGAPAHSVPAALAAPPPETGTMDLLLDVELPVSVWFGSAQLPLKDVLKLTSGSIVELDRSISEPVEVIINNCVIARGEVVVVEGNYGVRIQQIISRRERLQTIH